MKKQLLTFSLLTVCACCEISAQDDTVNELIGHKSQITSAGNGNSQTIISWKKSGDALWINTSGGDLCLRPYEWGGMHVLYGAEPVLQNHKSYAVTTTQQATQFEVEDTPQKIKLSTKRLIVTIDKKQGYITFIDASGKLLMREFPGQARKNVENDSVKASCLFQLQDGDALYGLGQFRDGFMNLRDKSRELIQFNTQAAVPVIYSTGGWGLFWDNPSRTLYSDTPSGMSFASDYGKCVDYYVFAGKDIDALVSGYRTLTGDMPMLPLWSLGFHQSRNRYHTEKELLNVVSRMKKENIPLSTIFIDYHFWGKYGTGSFRFDETAFPHVDQMLDSLHKTYDTKVVVTVWPCFKPGTDNYQDMESHGYILEGAKAIDGYIYDTFNPAAAEMYWNKFSAILKHDIDGWFLDGPEPDHVNSFLPTMTHDGPAQSVRNAYTLLHTGNFYKHLSQAHPSKRVYVLTRCAWAGQQKYGTAVWSGDIPTTFNELALQVAAGLNFTATGIPYWTTDIGGYLGGDPTDKNYRELFIRWFQYGTFCPVFRSHGRRYPGKTDTPNELWAYGKEAQSICTDFIRLRYKLMPYIYSMSEWVSNNRYTPMRLLAFDFASDKKVLNIKDQFMYGPALLVCPILHAGATSRQVYLPEGHRWIDYWNRTVYVGGKTINVDAPIKHIPLFVKAGSIIPYNATDTKTCSASTPLLVTVYEGADGQFDLYDDDGETLDYKNGDYRHVKFNWNNSTRTLHIAESKGKLNIGVRKIEVVLKSLDGKKDKSKNVKYNGKSLNVKL